MSITHSYINYYQSVTQTQPNDFIAHQSSINFQSLFSIKMKIYNEPFTIIIMKYLFANIVFVLLALLTCANTSSINTTDFFKLPIQTYSGYEDVDWYFPKGTASIYYSIWQGSNLPWADKTVPLIIWLQGGPGAPSQFGCFNEIGPVFIKGNKDNFKLEQNQWAWNFFGHLMCVDQPVGVGFSYNNDTKKVNNTKDAANHFANFLVNFLNNNKILGLSTNKIYLAGQSYAGHYIPAIADLFLTNSTLGINLAGIIIGDGYVDPLSQVNYYDSFLSSVGAVSKQWKDTTSFMQNQAMIKIMNGDLKNASGFINFIIANDDVANKYYGGMNVLNYKQYDAGKINQNYGIYLQKNKKAFGVPDWMNYVDDNQQMYQDFAVDLSTSFRPTLQKLLSYKLKTLIYNGQNDFIVNTVGVLSYLNNLEWTYSKQWKSQTKTIWKQFGTTNLGWYKNYANLMFVQVRNAGHLLPADQPRVAWEMINNYFLNQW